MKGKLLLLLLTLIEIRTHAGAREAGGESARVVLACRPLHNNCRLLPAAAAGCCAKGRTRVACCLLHTRPARHVDEVLAAHHVVGKADDQCGEVGGGRDAACDGLAQGLGRASGFQKGCLCD